VRTNWVAGACLLAAACGLQPLQGQDGRKRPVEVSKRESASLQSASRVLVEHSYGYLNVEAWDEPEIEVSVTKSTDRFYKPNQKVDAERRLDEVRVTTDQRSDAPFIITTTLPVRNSLFTSVLPDGRIVVTPPLLPKTKRGVTVECTIHLPRNTNLTVHHDNGYVWVSDVTGDLELHSHTGDMIVLLSNSSSYAIDARTRLGRVVSDFDGRGGTPLLIGSRFTHADEAPAHRVILRMGRGTITIKNGPPTGSFWKTEN
jgi:hypothetical protein